MGEGAYGPKAQCHPDRAGVDAAGGWSDSLRSYPGSAARLLARSSELDASRDATTECSSQPRPK